MELLALVLVWPLLFLVVGLVFISLGHIGSILLPIAIVFFLVAIFGLRDKLSSTSTKPASDFERLDRMRRGVVAFSIALLLPIFTQYLILVSDNSLSGIIFGLVLGFGTVVWGMFIKSNRVLLYSNVFGGALVIIYVYAQLWNLGQLPRIVAAGFGLAVAVAVSVAKLKDRLV